MSTDGYDISAAWEDLEDWQKYLGTETGRRAYSQVLARVPREVREFALDTCFVICVGVDVTGMAWNPSMIDRDRWLIVCMERPDLADGIAHEIAHAIRGDERHTPEIEELTDDLAERWGFQRSYRSGYHA